MEGHGGGETLRRVQSELQGWKKATFHSFHHFPFICYFSLIPYCSFIHSYFFFIHFGFFSRGTPCCAQRLPLALCSEITPSEAREIAQQ